MRLALVSLIASGQSFTCAPSCARDGDTPWCAESPRIRIAGIAACVIDRDRDLRPLLSRRPADGRERRCCRSSGCRHHARRGGCPSAGPGACLPPAHEAGAAGGARAVTFGQIAPRRCGPQHPKDAVRHARLIDTRRASWGVWQEWFDHAPLGIGQLISAHTDAE